MPKISCSLWGYREWTRERTIEDIGSIGYGAVEIVTHSLGTDVGYHLNQDELPLSDEELDQLRKELSKKNLKVSCLSPSTDFLAPEGWSAQDNFTVVKNSVDLATELGRPFVRPFPCASKPRYMTTEEALKIIVRGLKECAEYAESCDVKLAVDITHSRVTNIPRNAVEVIGRVDSEYCGVNIHTTGRTAMLLAEAFLYNGWGDKIFHTHLVDSRRILEEPYRQSVPLGEGDAYIEDFLRLLRDARYSGWYNFEGRKEDAKASFDYLTATLKKLRIT